MMARKSPKSVLVDTNVINGLVRKDAKCMVALRDLGQDRILVPSVVKMELRRWLFDIKRKDGTPYPANELAVIKRQIEVLSVVHIDRKVSDIALGFYQHHKELSMEVPDMLIAAVALRNDLELFTLNTKHFKFLKGVRLYIPPNF